MIRSRELQDLGALCKALSALSEQHIRLPNGTKILFDDDRALLEIRYTPGNYSVPEIWILPEALA